MTWLTNIREWLNGKKTYLAGIAAILTVTAAWASGEKDLAQYIAALWLALEGIFLRAGVKKAAFEASERAAKGAYDGAEEAITDHRNGR